MSGTTTGNTLKPPPRLSGDPKKDVLLLKNYVDDLYQLLALEQNVVGTQVQNVTNITNLGSEVTNLTTVVDGVGRVYDTRTAAVAAAAAGEVPVVLLSIRTQGFATPGDDGGAAYAWQATAPSWALSDPNRLLHFPDLSVRGGWWVLVESNPHAAMAGAFGDALGSDPTTGVSAALNTLLVYLHEQWRGGVIRLGHRGYLCDDHVDFQKFTGFVGPKTTGRTYEDDLDQEGIEAIPWQPGLVLASGKKLRVRPGFYLENVVWRRAGITPHTTLEGALDFQISGFAGTGLEKLGGGDLPSGTIINCAAFGFNFGFDLHKAPGLLINGFFGDCSTLGLVRNSGESIRVLGISRKPILGGNEATGIETLTVSAMVDDGGAVRFLTNENPLTLGLTDGQRIASDKAPTPNGGERRTVSNCTSAGFTLDDTAWDPAYASWTADQLAEIEFAFAPHLSSAVLSFSNDGGFVRANTAIEFPFKVGHFGLIGAPGNPARGFYQIKTVHAADDFTFDVAWDAGLSTIDLSRCEIAAMPNNRRHSSTVSYWGTTEGYALGLITCTGAEVSGRSKGGSGLFIRSSNSKIYWSGNEGGAPGEIDLNDPDTHGIYNDGNRNVVYGLAAKSTGTAGTLNARKRSDIFSWYSAELSGSGRALWDQTGGAMAFVHASVRGENQTILLDQIGYLMFLGGEVTPEMLDATNAVDDIERTHFILPADTTSSDAKILRYVSNSHRFETNEGGTASTVLTIGSDGSATFAGPIAAPNLPAVFTATATTTGTTAQALTDAGTAAAGTVSGYSLTADRTVRLLRIEIVAQRTNGTGSATDSECAIWDLVVLMSRGTTNASTALVRSGGLGPIAPTLSYDASGTNSAGWTVALSNSSQHLVIDVAGATGATINWLAKITVLEVA